MKRDVQARLGTGPNGAEDIKKHAFFAGINWSNVAARATVPPILPKIQSELDVSNFDKRFTDLVRITYILHNWMWLFVFMNHHSCL